MEKELTVSLNLAHNPAQWSEADREAVEGLLPAYVAVRRWYRGKGKDIEKARLLDVIPVTERAALCVVETQVRSESVSRYILPLSVMPQSEVNRVENAAPLSIVPVAGNAVLCDAVADSSFLTALLLVIAQGAQGDPAGAPARLRCQVFGQLLGQSDDVQHLAPKLLGVEQSNSTVIYGQQYALKLIRKLEEGESCELELSRFLTRAGFAHTPSLLGALSWLPTGGQGGTIGILQTFVPNRGAAWERTLDRLSELVRLPYPAEGEAPPALLVQELERIQLLGRRTAELHRALSGPSNDPAFEPVSFTLEDQKALIEAMWRGVQEDLAALGRRTEGQSGVRQLLARAEELRQLLDRFRGEAVGGKKIRIHGDLHLGQILEVGEDVSFIDFEGEPARPLEERRQRRHPLVDVAGMLRSFDYAAVTARRSMEADSRGAAWLSVWQNRVEKMFRETYFAVMDGSTVIPVDPGPRRHALELFMLEKCLYELHYELHNRPDWLAVPVSGLSGLLDRAKDRAKARPRSENFS